MKQHIFKSHLCCAFWSQTWLCIKPCFYVYAGYKIIFQTRPHCLRFSVSQHDQLGMQQACLFWRQSGFRFSTAKFLRDQLASLFVEDMAKRKVIVLPVDENNTFLKFIYAVRIDLKFDYTFSLVLMSMSGTRSYSRLEPIVQGFLFPNTFN